MSNKINPLTTTKPSSQRAKAGSSAADSNRLRSAETDDTKSVAELRVPFTAKICLGTFDKDSQPGNLSRSGSYDSSNTDATPATDTTKITEEYDYDALYAKFEQQIKETEMLQKKKNNVKDTITDSDMADSDKVSIKQRLNYLISGLKDVKEQGTSRSVGRCVTDMLKQVETLTKKVDAGEYDSKDVWHEIRVLQTMLVKVKENPQKQNVKDKVIDAVSTATNLFRRKKAKPENVVNLKIDDVVPTSDGDVTL